VEKSLSPSKSLEHDDRSPYKERSRQYLIVRAFLLMSMRERLGALGLAALTLASGLAEMALVSLVAPIVYVVVDSESFAQSRMGAVVGQWVDLSDALKAVPALIGAVFVLLVASAAIRMLLIFYSERHSAVCRARVSRETLRKLIEAPVEWTERLNLAFKLNLIADDIAIWRRDFLNNLLLMLQSVFLICLPATAVFLIASFKGLAAILAIGIVVGAVVAFFRPRIRRSSADAKSARDVCIQNLIQAISGTREIKMSGRPSYFVERFDRENRLAAAFGVVARLWASAPGIIVMTLGQIGFLGATLFVWATSQTTADAVVQLALMGVLVARVMPAFNGLGNQAAQLSRAAPNVDSMLRSIERLDQAIAADKKTRTAKVPDDWRQIAFRGVAKSYPGSERAAVARVDAAFERGRIYGLVGRSGSGKTTLVNMLAGLIEPSEGDIMVGSVRLADIDRDDWRSRLGYVSQTPFILDTDIGSNVTFGMPTDPARIAQAIEAARLTRFLASLPQGTETPVGERGATLSGGQNQRIAIARAFYRNPEILIFDEATSALDNETEREIQETLSRRDPGRVTLIVAHRIHTLKHCDEILVIDEGKLVDSGRFDDLAARSAVFQAMLAAGPASMHAAARPAAE
jgi:ABC-type multidrug transport system fused ATPase/permease subunit